MGTLELIIAGISGGLLGFILGIIYTINKVADAEE